VNIALLLKQPRLKNFLLKHLAYYANGWYLFEGKTKLEHEPKNSSNEKYNFKVTDSCTAKVVIVAKAHYSQTWQSYTSVSKKELQQILTLQKNNENSAATIFQVNSNKAIDGFEVKKITFDAQLLNTLGEQRLLIPETELLSLQDSQQQKLSKGQTWLSSFETPMGTLFASCFADKCVSSYAGGLISSIDTFKLSSGLPAEVESTHINKQCYASFLFNCVTKEPLDRLYPKVAFNAKTWFKVQDLHLLYWAPLLTACAFYLLSNSYLWIQSHNIGSSLAEQGNEVTHLLEKKYQQDKKSQLLNLLNVEFSKTSTVHSHWSLVYRLVESGMMIDRLTFAENVLSIRGKAPNASKVLTDITKVDDVSSATFKGSVSKSRGLESFVLELVPVMGGSNALANDNVKLIDKVQGRVERKAKENIVR